MSAMGRLSVLFVFIIALHPGNCFKCYSCNSVLNSNCSDLRGTVPTTDCDQKLTLSSEQTNVKSGFTYGCIVAKGIDPNQNVSLVMRGCMPLASTFCGGWKGYDKNNICNDCYTDLCNSARVPDSSFFVFLFTSSLVALLSVKS